MPKNVLPALFLSRCRRPQAMDTADAGDLAMSFLCWSVRPTATYACRRPAPFAILGRFYIATADSTGTR